MSHRGIHYEEAKYRYENTPESARSISLHFGFSPNWCIKKARSGNWVKYSGKPKDQEENVPPQPKNKNQPQEKSIGIPIVEEHKWEILDDNYVWKASKGVINIPVEKIDQLFYEYSEYGLNLSQTEIINKHNLQVWEWNSIKNTLWLFKKSNIFSPHTVSNTPPEELQTIIAGKIKAMLSNTGLQVEKQYNKEINKKYKEVIKAQTLQDVTLQSMILELHDVIPKAEVKPLVRVENKGNGTICVFLFDLHYGAENRTDHTPKYSPEIVRSCLMQAAEIINSHRAKRVHVFFGGDYIETFSGKNHEDSWKGLAKGYYGAKVIKELYKLLVEFLSEVNNLCALYAVPGNHDRAADDARVESEGSMAEILFELVKLSYKGKIEIVYDEKIVSQEIDGINYIMLHGQFNMVKMAASEMVLKYGNPYLFNFVASGHLHSRIIKKDHEMFRHMVCPSFFVGNDYSVNLGFTASPGFIITKNSGRNNKPIVFDYTF